MACSFPLRLVPLVAVATLVLGACGGGGGDARVSQPAIAGVYGHDSATLVVAADGRFIGFDGGFFGQVAGTHHVVYSGVLAVNGTSWSAPAALVGQTSSSIGMPAPVTTIATSRVDGTFVEGVSITRDIELALHGRIPDPRTLAFFSDPVYRSASPAVLAGSYTHPGGTLTVTQDGVLQGSWADNCAISGSARAFVADRNVYSLTATLSGTGCPGISGRSYEMLGYLASQPSPRLVVVADIDSRMEGFSAGRN